MPRFRPLFCLFPALLTWCVPGTVWAKAVEEARAAYADLDYDSCRQSATAALREPGTLSERVSAYRLLGLCAAALDDGEAALDAFIQMLAIDPTAELPRGVSPRFRSSYLEARGHWGSKPPIALQLEADHTEGKRRVVRLRVIDEAGLIDRIAWQDDEGERAPALKSAPRMELEVPAELLLTVVALDARSGVVAELVLPTNEPVPVAAQTQAATETDPTDASGVWLWTSVGVGTALVVLGGGAAVAAALLAPPARVDLQSTVVFGNP
ncbi:MAG: tetratricopeptide repeat protein [Myxococcota bacterium]